jgi:DNA polymerase-3 subunit chi
MSAVNFYHLTSTPLGKALPRLLDKVIANDHRVLVVCNDEQKLSELNNSLWTFSTKIFLPHGTKEDGFESEQPIFLSPNYENPNGADILVVLEETPIEQISNYKKCLYLFDGNNDQQTKNARQRWKQLKQDGVELTYWQQDKKGQWVKGNS